MNIFLRVNIVVIFFAAFFVSFSQMMYAEGQKISLSKSSKAPSGGRWVYKGKQLKDLLQKFASAKKKPKKIVVTNIEIDAIYREWIRNKENRDLLLPVIVVIQDNDGYTPLHAACFEGDSNAVAILLNEGVNPNVQTEGLTPLYLTCNHYNEKIFKLLLDKGADPNTPDRNGSTPLHAACYDGQTEVVKLLLEGGANPNISNNGRYTPLHYACFRGHEEVVKLLLENGVNINIQNKNGNTPLHAAANSGQRKIVELLINKGANTSIKNKDGKTALNFVRSKITKLLERDSYIPSNYKDIVQLLEERTSSSKKRRK